MSSKFCSPLTASFTVYRWADPLGWFPRLSRTNQLASLGWRESVVSEVLVQVQGLVCSYTGAQPHFS